MQVGSLIETTNEYKDIENILDECIYLREDLYPSIVSYYQVLVEDFGTEKMKNINSTVKQAVDRGDKNRIKFVFIDALDVDPTFSKYLPEFLYAKKHGMFEPNKNLSQPFISDQNRWDENYWIKLKKDFKQNPSIERLNHMRKVAKVVHKDKVDRLHNERRGILSPEKRKEAVEEYKFNQDQKVLKGKMIQQQRNAEKQKQIQEQIKKQIEEQNKQREEKLKQSIDSAEQPQGQNIQQTLNQTMQQAQNKPKPVLYRIVSSLRNLYKKWLNKQNRAKAQGQDIGFFKNICRMILNCIDRLMKRIRIMSR